MGSSRTRGLDAAGDPPGHHTSVELHSQPAMWRRTAATPRAVLDRLPADGVPVLVLGCGTSYYIGESYARRRVAAGLGPTRAEIPSELNRLEPGESVMLLSRSGTTGDLVTLGAELRKTHPVVTITGAPATPIADLEDTPNIALTYADERSVMQTRFATTALSLLRRSIGEDIEPIALAGEEALDGPLPLDEPALAELRHVVFLGTKATAALAQEAALKVREAAGFWTEAYPLFEYQHGPISCAGPRSLVWALCDVPDSVARDIEATGARLVVSPRDAQAELVRVHRLAVALALRDGRNPDAPPHLSRSVQVSELGATKR